MGNLVEYRNFSANFGGSSEVVHGINFSVSEHEIVAIVGESGSGKTVTAQALLRLQRELTKEEASAANLGGKKYLPVKGKISYGGEILFEGRDVLAMDEAGLRSFRGSRVGMVFQEPMTSLNPLHVVEKQLSESLALHGKVKRADARPMIIEALKQVGLRDAEKRLSSYPHELSGGERQRVMIALALLNSPRLLIADEPTTALDVTIQAQILALLKHLQKNSSMAVLFITHDLGIVRRFADRVIVMKDGLIIEQGSTPAIFGAPRTDYTKLLINAEDFKFGKRGDPSSSIESAVRPVKEDAALVAEVHNLKVHFPVKKGIFKKVQSWIKAVDGVSFSLHRGEALGLVGESGSGKTTLGKALLRLIPSTGNINILGADINDSDEKALRPLRPHMQMIFQDPYGSLSPRRTVREIVGEGLLVHKKCPKEEYLLRVCRALAEVGLIQKLPSPARQGGSEKFDFSGLDILDRYPNEFSGGQRQRIAIARSLILEPDILVLDEPTSALDRTVQVQVIELLRNLQQKRNLAYIFISHDLRVVRSLCQTVLIMKDGLVVEHGPTKKILDHPENPYTKELVDTAFGR